MELVIKPSHDKPCQLKIFTINGKAAKKLDFGDSLDHLEGEHKYCGNMQFEPKPPTPEVLQRYNITVDEYNAICKELEDKLYVGECARCFDWLYLKK